MEVLFALTLCIIEDILTFQGRFCQNFFFLLTISHSSCLCLFDDEGGEK